MSRRIPLPHLAGAALVHYWRRGAVELGGPMRALNMKATKPVIFHSSTPKLSIGDKTRAEALLSGQFSYAAQNLDIGAQGDPWTVAVPSVRFAQWLHRFDWLHHMAVSPEKAAGPRARALVDSWITTYGRWNEFSWDPDILAARLFNWMVLWSPLLSGDNLGEPAEIRRQSVLRQLQRLRRTYRRTTPGLPRLQAAAALALGGSRLKDKSERFLSQGLDWLDDEIEKQILSDGGHISRSPQQALDALEILLFLDSLLQARGIKGSRVISRAIDRLVPMIAFFTAADGKLACFNGSGEEEARRIKAVMKAAPNPAKPFSYCPHTGYQRIDQGGTVMLVDTGTTPPRPFDTDAHLAPLAFELSTPLGRLVVNCGWSEELPLRFRSFMRSTAAHSTLTLDNHSAGTLLRRGWKTKILGTAVDVQAGPVNAKRKEQDSGVWLEGSHDGYREWTGLSHRRRLYMSIDGDDIRGEDSLYVPLGAAPHSREEKPFQIRFHFHPDVRVSLSQDQKSALLVQGGKAGWRFRADGGPLTLEDSVYLGAGIKPAKSQQIVISGSAFCDSDGETRSNRVRWAFRKLEARN